MRGDPWQEARYRFERGRAAHAAGRLEEALEHYGAFLEAVRARGDRKGEGMALYALGLVCEGLRRWEEAEAYLAEAVRCWEETGSAHLEEAREALERVRTLGRWSRRLGRLTFWRRRG